MSTHPGVPAWFSSIPSKYCDYVVNLSVKR